MSRNGKPVLVAIGGLSGTGKSTLAHALAPRLGAAVLRSDVIRKRLAGIPSTAPLPPSAYAPQARAAAYYALFLDIRTALDTETSVIADAVWSAAEDRAALEALAAAAAIPFHGLWLVAPLETTLRRVASRVGDASDADEHTLRAQATTQAAPPPSWTIISAVADPATVLETALSALAHTVR